MLQVIAHQEVIKEPRYRSSLEASGLFVPFFLSKIYSWYNTRKLSSTNLIIYQASVCSLSLVITVSAEP